jgi:hypothetical protein
MPMVPERIADIELVKRSKRQLKLGKLQNIACKFLMYLKALNKEKNLNRPSGSKGA